jgi:hypothetical protein
LVGGNGGEAAAAELRVFCPFQGPRNRHAAIGIHRNQMQIEQSVNVGAQQQSVGVDRIKSDTFSTIKVSLGAKPVARLSLSLAG